MRQSQRSSAPHTGERIFCPGPPATTSRDSNWTATTRSRSPRPCSCSSTPAELTASSGSANGTRSSSGLRRLHRPRRPCTSREGCADAHGPRSHDPPIRGDLVAATGARRTPRSARPSTNQPPAITSDSPVLTQRSEALAAYPLTVRPGCRGSQLRDDSQGRPRGLVDRVLGQFISPTSLRRSFTCVTACEDRERSPSRLSPLHDPQIWRLAASHQDAVDQSTQDLAARRHRQLLPLLKEP